MWKRPITWITLFLIVLANLAVWDIDTLPRLPRDAVVLFAEEVEGRTELVTLRPSGFSSDNVRLSYVMAVLIGGLLPVILPILLRWLWLKRQPLTHQWHLLSSRKKRGIALSLVLMAVCNFMAWEIGAEYNQYRGAIPLFQEQFEDGIDYTVLRPEGFYFDSALFSYALALFIGFALPFILPPLVRRLLDWRRAQARTTETYHLEPPKMGRNFGAALVSLILFVAFNVLAWNWVESTDKTTVGIEFSQTERLENDGWSARRRTVYAGISPAILIYNNNVSWLLSILVGEVLPFMLAASLLRRRQPSALPQRPVTGAPR